mmetsp:Transcript_43075/g.69932  ORF Transcript_43075/g.69932 Transcript_43075/m.69932 type:complete len:127 (+) Transcript_43075:276-656(+)|eukprot:CAMPEP_0184661648 /NCGR_PEP_ID=MMETSP0308-20130426/39429_1 /TAXON_ID=38269 /ORGANISM="Gloeochaete witrockiana, Strain SAG 46.84" /LENGTH=126 /DNA_ID=CAMNT_0027103101 /DNA_START=267 /DNA_END=650 /DNA_ORIENTATION=+
MTKAPDSRALIHKLRSVIRTNEKFIENKAKYMKVAKKKLSDFPKAQLFKIAEEIGIDTKPYETKPSAVKPAVKQEPAKKETSSKKTSKKGAKKDGKKESEEKATPRSTESKALVDPKAEQNVAASA